MKESISKEDLRDLLETPLGVFVFVIRNFIELLEENPDEKDDEFFPACMETNKKIGEIIQKEGFFDERDDMKQILEICESLPEKNCEIVMFLLDNYLSMLDESLETAKGKPRKRQEKLYDDILEILCEIREQFKKFDSEKPYYDAIFTSCDSLTELYNDDCWAENEEDADWAKFSLDTIKIIREKLEKIDSSKSFDENLFALYDSLAENEKEFFYEELIQAGIEDFDKKLADLQDEYYGLDVDLSQHENDLAAIKQIKRKMQKKYAL